MKMKLCNLKYAPKTAVAVVVKAMRILFMPNVMTEPIEPMMIDGTPANTSRIIPPTQPVITPIKMAGTGWTPKLIALAAPNTL